MTYDPELYAAVHRGNEGDARYYLELARRRQSVLELGAGYGRIAMPLVEAGLRYLGLELEPDYIQLCERFCRERGLAQTPTMLQADMAAFELSERFDCVIIPFAGLYCLDNQAAQIACLTRIHAHLHPGGLLAFDGYCADAMHDDCDADEDCDGGPSEPEFVVSIDHQGQRYDVFESSTWDRAAQTIDATYGYYAQDGQGAYRGRIRQRYLLGRQIEPLLREAGFRDIRIHGGFDGEPFDSEGELLVVQALRCD